MFNNEPNEYGCAKIRVVGVGGAGNNAINRMMQAGIRSAEYVAVNTDKQILNLSLTENRIQIGEQLTKGLGAGANPEIGRQAAEESTDALIEAITGTDLLFIAAGMGGGTGTGAAPVVARLARELGILTIAIVTEPFAFEGKRRQDNTRVGLEGLKQYVDTLIIIPNDKISSVVGKNTPLNEALSIADEILKQGIRGIADLIVNPALINLDFADVKTIIQNQGIAHMGVGVAKGENRIVEAVRLAVNSPLLETTIEGARGVILNIVGGDDLTLDEVRTAATLIQGVVDYSANIIFGACIDQSITDEVEVTVIATGFPQNNDFLEPKKPENVLNNMNVGSINAKPADPAFVAVKKPEATVEGEQPTIEKVRENEGITGSLEAEEEAPTIEKVSKELPSFVTRLFNKKHKDKAEKKHIKD